MTLNSKQQSVEFIPVYNGRKRKVRSLWQRGGTFYARLKITYPGEEEAKVRRVPLKAKTVPEATKELRELQVKRDKGQTIVRERTPTLKEYGQKYIDRLFTGNRKRPKTITSENGHLRFWTRELGQHRFPVYELASALGMADMCPRVGIPIDKDLLRNLANRWPNQLRRRE